MFRFPQFEKPVQKQQAIIFEKQQKSVSTVATEKYIEFLSNFSSEIVALNLKQKDTTRIIEMSKDLMKNFNDLNQKWMSEDDSKPDPVKVLDLTYDIAINNLSSFQSVTNEINCSCQTSSLSNPLK